MHHKKTIITTAIETATNPNVDELWIVARAPLLLELDEGLEVELVVELVVCDGEGVVVEVVFGAAAWRWTFSANPTLNASPSAPLSAPNCLKK